MLWKCIKPVDEEVMPNYSRATQPCWRRMMNEFRSDLGMTTTHAERHIEKRKKKKETAQEGLQEMQRQARSALEKPN
jgi:hypothetical protein